MNKVLMYSLFIFLTLNPPGHAQNWLIEKTKDILFLQDQRKADSILIRYFSDQDVDVRFRADLACANIQDSSVNSRLIRLLHDQDDRVRMAAAFAIGQIGSHSIAQILIQQLKIEKDDKVRFRIYEALGKTITANEYDTFFDEISLTEKSNESVSIAACIARAAIRNITSQKSLTMLSAFTHSKYIRTRFYAAYALSRLRKSELIDAMSDETKNLIQDSSPDVRMFAASASAYLSDTILFFQIAAKALRDRDWRVKVNILRAIGSSHFDLSENIVRNVIQRIDHRDVHTCVMAMQTITAKKTNLNKKHLLEIREKLTAYLENPKIETVIKSEAAIALAKIFPHETSSLLLTRMKKAREFLRPKYIEALSWVDEERIVDIVSTILNKDSSISVRIAAMKVLFEQRKNLTKQNQIRVVDYHLGCMRSNDIALITQAAENCADSIFINLKRQVIVHEALHALSRLNNLSDVEPIVALCTLLEKNGDSSCVRVLKEKLNMEDRVIRSAAVNALEKITGEKFSQHLQKPIAPIHQDYDWNYLVSIKLNEKIEIRTSKGNIIVQLDVTQAPFTVMNFLKLVDKKFYDGLIIHRVVPNFVIQGGDPRGDGWGGPGWTMRSEFGLNYFERGSIGIASAGKDTEGSQFFITHCSTSHLDGRYTCFGTVIKGLNVVDRIQIGDKILSIRRIR